MATSEEHSRTYGEAVTDEPLLAASAVLGRKWHSTIVHRLLEYGPQGFGDLEARIDGISEKVLSESLSDLEARGLVERRVLETKPVRVEYSLTTTGQGLCGTIDELRRWCWEYCSSDL